MEILRRKERLNPAIQLYTYENVLAATEKTIAFLRHLKTEAIVASERGESNLPA